MTWVAGSYVLVVLPPADLTREIIAVRQRLGVPDPEAMTPHITLKMPFQPTGDLRLLVQRLDQVAAAISPFSICARGIGTFRGRQGNVVYVAIENSYRLRQLHQAMVTALSGLATNVSPSTHLLEMDSYVPHITIALDVADGEFQRMLDALSDYHPRHIFQVDTVRLMQLVSAGPWRTIRRFRLGGQSYVPETPQEHQSQKRDTMPARQSPGA